MRLSIKPNEKGSSASFEKMIYDYLEENASDVLVEKINGGKKTLAGAWAFITTEARKKAVSGCACIEDAEVFGWAIHYFEEDAIKADQKGERLAAPTVTSATSKKPEKKTEAPKKPEPSFMQLSFADM